MSSIKKRLRNKIKKKAIYAGLYIVTKIKPLPQHWQYQRVFVAWQKDDNFKAIFEQIKPYTLISQDRCYNLYRLGLQCRKLDGCWFECGIYKGGSAMLLAKILEENSKGITLHLFDTFCGMPVSNPKIDLHKKDDFSDISLEEVKDKIYQIIGQNNFIRFHKGFIPDTFKKLETEKISFAHIDVDLYKSVMDCCNFIYPRLSIGGIIIFDDYGAPSCPGATKAINDFFRDKPNVPLSLPIGQAVLFKSSKRS